MAMPMTFARQHTPVQQRPAPMPVAMPMMFARQPTPGPRQPTPVQQRPVPMPVDFPQGGYPVTAPRPPVAAHLPAGHAVERIVANPPVAVSVPFVGGAPSSGQVSSNKSSSLGPRQVGFKKGDIVDYYSTSNQCWIPAVVKDLNPENGDMQLDVKPQIRLQDQEHCLRPRTQPSAQRIDWMHTVMREGLLMKEAQILWSDFLRAQRLTTTVPRSALHGLAGKIDEKLGTCGSMMRLLDEAKQGNRDLLTFDGFHDVFFHQLSAALSTWGQVVPRGEGLFRYDENPANYYHLADVKVLGQGSFGKVLLVREKRAGRALRAVKCIEKAKLAACPELLDTEVENLCLVDHPHIARLIEYFNYESSIYLVMDYMSGGELLRVIQEADRQSRQLPANFTSGVTRQILLAVSHIHAHCLVHLDIKSANIMLMPNEETKIPLVADGEESQNVQFVSWNPKEVPHVMVIDLGISQIFRPGNFRHHSPMGTPGTMAPEVWSGEITPKADIFSTGCVLYEMMTLRLPFLRVPCDRAGALRFWQSVPGADWSAVRGHPAEAVELGKDMMTKQRQLRPIAVTCLQHAFVKEAMLPIKVKPTVMSTVKAYPERSMLYKSFAFAIAHRWEPNKWPTVMKLFKDLDVQCSGRIERADLSGSLQRHGFDAHEAARIAEAMDLDRDGTVTWTEFVASCIPLDSPDFEPLLKEAFDTADDNSDGLLTQGDLAKIFPASSGPEVVRSCFIDLTGRTESGARIDWSTFSRHFRTTSNKFDYRTSDQLAPQKQSFWELLTDEVDKVCCRCNPQPGDPKREAEFLLRLAEMGFKNRELNLSVIRKNRGQLSDGAVEEIARLSAH